MAEKNRPKLLVLLLAALVGIGGTVTTGIFQGDYKSKLAITTLNYSSADSTLVQSAALLQRAYQFEQHAEILKNTGRSGLGWDVWAKKYAFASVHLLNDFLASNNEVTEISQESRCGRSSEQTEVSDNTLAEQCYAKLVKLGQVDRSHKIERLERELNLLNVLATSLQLLGIGIGFAKDLL